MNQESKSAKMLEELQSRHDSFVMETVEMSGFGKNTTYEMGMQRMIWLGMEWLKGKKLRVFDGMHGYAGIIGVESTEHSQLGELEEIWRNDPFLQEGGITGAMHQYVLHHLKSIAEEGYLTWFQLARDQDPSRIILVKMWH